MQNMLGTSDNASSPNTKKLSQLPRELKVVKMLKEFKNALAHFR